MTTKHASKPFLNRRFAITLVTVTVCFAVFYPFSPAVRQQRQMHTMEMFWSQLQDQLKDDPRYADLEGGVVTNVSLRIMFDHAVDDETWQKLIRFIELKRDAYQHVSPIIVNSYDSAKGRGQTYTGK